MDVNKVKQINKDRRKARIRAKVKGTAETPRLSVFRSSRGMYLQLIDDQNGKTLVSAHSKEVKISAKDKEGSKKTDISFELGKLIAKKAVEKNIKQAVFDRGGNKYHGRVMAAAEGAREGGLEL